MYLRGFLSHDFYQLINLYRYLSIQMGQTSNGQTLPNTEYSLQRELPNGSIVKEQLNGKLHFLKEYSFTNQEAYQQAFVNFSKKLPDKHQHILYLERTNTKLQNTFCSTFYKISLLYEYLDHTLQKEIQRRNRQGIVFDQNQVWSVLCSCVLGVSEMIRAQGRCHAALLPKDIRLNHQNLVKILSLEMIGMDSDHDLNKEGTTRMLAVTILNCLMMQEITNESEELLLQLVENLSCSTTMKTTLRMMLDSRTNFIELEEYLYRMVQEETDSLTSYSNTPNLRDKTQKRDNSYSKIPEESKEDDSLAPMPRDTDDCGQNDVAEPVTQQEQIPDENDNVDNNSTQNTLRQSNTPQLSRNESPASKKFNITGPQEHSLFTDPKLLNLIHMDLEDIKKRKSIAGSRKMGTSDSKPTIEKFDSKVLQTNNFNTSHNIVTNQKQSYKQRSITRKENQASEFKAINISSSASLPSTAKENHSQSTSNIRMGEELRHSKTSTNMRSDNQQLQWNGMKESAQFTNPEKKMTERRYENIMQIEDMGFKKNKGAKVKEQSKEQSRVSSSISNSNVSNTIIYNSNQSSNLNQAKTPGNTYNLMDKSKLLQDINQQSRVSRSTRGQLEYVTQTYIRGRYEGTKLNNMRHGKGVFYYNEGGKYIGEWKENKMNGKGVLYYPNNEIAYDGQWKNDQLWGKGTLYNEEITNLNGSFDYKNWENVDDYWIKYQGQFAQDSKNGQGKLYLSNGQIFEGQFRDDMIWGEGVMMRRDGSRVKGLWRQNKLIRLY